MRLALPLAAPRTIDSLHSAAQIGGAAPNSSPKNAGSATPTIWNGCPSSDTDFPSTFAALPYSLRQNAALITAAAGQPAWSSAAVSRRPNAGRTPSTGKKPPLTNANVDG